MNAMIAEHPAPPEAPPQRDPTEAEREQAVVELCDAVRMALESYANVHRGSGHHSTVTTYLYEQARAIVLAHLGRSSATDTVIFCTPRRAAVLARQLDPRHFTALSSQDVGLPLGLRALVVRRRALPQGTPFETGGGTARLVGPDWVVWAAAPDRFEAGTPPIINVIAFAWALELTRRFGWRVFAGPVGIPCSAADILAHDELAHLTGHELLDALNQTLLGRDVLVPTTDGPRPFINLDNAASTPTFAPIWDVVQQAWRQPKPTQAEIVREVRSICAAALGAPPASYELIFTANTTEAINLVAESLGHEVAPESEPVVLNTMLEHNSNELPWRTIPGVQLARLAIDDEGFVSLAELEAVLQEYNQRSEHGPQRIALVAVSGASNVLGVVNDLAAISAIMHRYGARLLVDAAQLVAHRKVEMERWSIDYLACSAHKVYAPFGSGLLVARAGLLRFSPVERELIGSSGEENVGGIAALGKALLLLQRIGLEVVQAREQALTAQALRGLAQILGLEVYGVKSPDASRFAWKGGVIVFSIQSMLAPEVAQQLAARGMGVRAGCHCAHLLVKQLLKIPPPLAQFQRVLVTLLPKLSLPGLTRVNLGLENTDAEIDRLIEGLRDISQERRAPRRPDRTAPHVNVQQQLDASARAAAQSIFRRQCLSPVEEGCHEG